MPQRRGSWIAPPRRPFVRRTNTHIRVQLLLPVTEMHRRLSSVCLSVNATWHRPRCSTPGPQCPRTALLLSPCGEAETTLQSPPPFPRSEINTIVLYLYKTLHTHTLNIFAWETFRFFMSRFVCKSVCTCKMICVFPFLVFGCVRVCDVVQRATT